MVYYFQLNPTYEYLLFFYSLFVIHNFVFIKLIFVQLHCLQYLSCQIIINCSFVGSLTICILSLTNLEWVICPRSMVILFLFQIILWNVLSHCTIQFWRYGIFLLNSFALEKLSLYICWPGCLLIVFRLLDSLRLFWYCSGVYAIEGFSKSVKAIASGIWYYSVRLIYSLIVSIRSIVRKPLPNLACSLDCAGSFVVCSRLFMIFVNILQTIGL